MQFSETLVAAMIGAVATMSTALFQLYSAFRSKSKFESRPKRGMTVRSVIAVIALMLASGVGGFLYSELRQERASEDIHSMRDELNAKLQVLATTTERLAAHESAMAQTAITQNANNVESVLYAPACGVNCSEANAQHLTLCGAVPNAMQVSKVELFAKGATAQAAWEQAATTFENDIGGAKFVGAPTEHPQDDAHKAVCVEFIHWSAEPHLARIVLQYGAHAIEQSPEGSPAAVAAAPSALPNTHVASMGSTAN